MQKLYIGLLAAATFFVGLIIVQEYDGLQTDASGAKASAASLQSEMAKVQSEINVR